MPSNPVAMENGTLVGGRERERERATHHWKEKHFAFSVSR